MRSLVWLSGLLAVSLLAQIVLTAHQLDERGLPRGFPPPVAEADVPMPGINVALEQFDDEALDEALERIAAAGFTWVRQTFTWHQVEPEPGRFDWTVPDRLLAALARYPRLRLVAVLDDAPSGPPQDPDRFAGFAAAFASRYGAQVDYYQVWDEPNLADRWGGGPVSPPAYADLLARTARAVRAADPDARILLAGLAPTVETGPQNLSDVSYLDQLYRAGAAPNFDIAAGKPYGFDSGPDDRRADQATLNFSRLLLLREVMVAHGDADKALWASHWGWNALPPGWEGWPSIWGQTDEATQAAYTVAALERARAEWPWAGALILESFQPLAPADDPRWGFAVIEQDGTLRPVYQAIASWAAALPDAAPAGGYPAQNPWATYEGQWTLGAPGADAGADGDRVTFHFDGTAAALTVRRGPYPAFLVVTIDGEPANALALDRTGQSYIVLYDKTAQVATVPLAHDLPAGPHTVEIVAEGGQGQWMLVDWRVASQPAGDGWAWKGAGLAAAALVLTFLLVRDARRVRWDALARALLSRPAWMQAALGTGLVGLLWLAAGLSWGRDWSSPWLLVSLLLLPALVGFFALRPDLGLVSVALTAPFYLHPGSMFYGTLSLPETLLLLCGMGMAIRRRKDSETEKREKGNLPAALDFAVALLIIAASVASIAAPDRKAALLELRSLFLIPGLTYVLTRQARLDRQGRWRIVDGLVIGACGVALIGLAQYVTGIHVVLAEGGLPRLQSVYYSPNNVGLYLERVWPFLVVVALWERQGRRRTLYRLALLPVTLALALSFSRGALLLGMPAALLVVGWRAGKRWRLAALTLVALGALALIPLLRLPRFASMFDLQQGSSFFRLELWTSSLALIRDHPWFGVGPGNFASAYRTHYILPSAWAEPNLEHPHNIALDHWTRLGLLGLLAGALIQIAFWRAISSSQAPPAARSLLLGGLAGSMAALLAHGLVDNTLFFPDLALLFFMTLALAEQGSPRPTSTPGEDQGSTTSASARETAAHRGVGR